MKLRRAIRRSVAKNWRPQIPGDGSGCLPAQITIETSQRLEQTFYLRLAQSGPVAFGIDWGDGHIQRYEMMQETRGARLEVRGTPIGDKLTLGTGPISRLMGPGLHRSIPL